MPIYTTSKPSHQAGDVSLYFESEFTTNVFLNSNDPDVRMIKKEPFWNPVLVSSFLELTANQEVEIRIPYTKDPHTLSVFIMPNPIQPSTLGRIQIRVNDDASTPLNLVEGYPWVQQLPEHYIETIKIKAITACKVLVDGEICTPSIGASV